MTTAAPAADVATVVAEMLAALETHRQIAPFSARPGGLGLADAYRVTPQLRAGFEARGETVVGRKIGFTNRTMWPVYGVHAPIWGYATDATTHALADTAAVHVADFCEPKIEPEIMFGLSAAPAPEMDEAALIGCVGWVALGFEVVQSIYPGWRFAPADTVAANGLHGALYVGARVAPTPQADWMHMLTTFTVELSCGDRRVLGSADDVLGGPLTALRHLVAMLAHDAHNPPLAAGEIVSTGTLTQAMPVEPGECWTANVSGIPLPAVSLRFA